MEAEVAQSGLSTIEAAIAEATETGEHQYLAESHRIRGEILLKRDPADTAPAEEAFLTAIAIAQQQKARSFELRAALSLARLYQSTGRAVDAHAVLAPALEGFSPTLEFPEIAEAQTLLATLLSSNMAGLLMSIRSPARRSYPTAAKINILSVKLQRRSAYCRLNMTSRRLEH
jgi:predicted ATPase